MNRTKNYPKFDKLKESFLYFSDVFLVSAVILVRNKCILWLPLLCRLDVWVVRDRPADLHWSTIQQEELQQQANLLLCALEFILGSFLLPKSVPIGHILGTILGTLVHSCTQLCTWVHFWVYWCNPLYSGTLHWRLHFTFHFCTLEFHSDRLWFTQAHSSSQSKPFHHLLCVLGHVKSQTHWKNITSRWDICRGG